jgi:hypothetical protein
LLLPAAELEVVSPPGGAEVLMPAKVEVPLGLGAVEVLIAAEVEVPLGSGAAAVPMAVAEPGAGEVPMRPTAPASLTPPSSMLCPLPDHFPCTTNTNEEQILHKLTMFPSQYYTYIK